jgi:hypothetical protein
MAGERLNLPHNGVILTHSSNGPELSLWGQSNGKWAYLWRSNVIRLNLCFYFQLSFNLAMTFPFLAAVAVYNMTAYLEMQRIQHTAVILYVWRTGDTGQRYIVQTLHDDVPSHATVGCRNEARQGEPWGWAVTGAFTGSGHRGENCRGPSNYHVKSACDQQNNCTKVWNT